MSFYGVRLTSQYLTLHMHRIAPKLEKRGRYLDTAPITASRVFIKMHIKTLWFMTCSSREKPGHDADKIKLGFCADHLHRKRGVPQAKDGDPSGQQEEVS